MAKRDAAMKRWFLAALTASVLATGAYAQSDESGPFVTPSGAVLFVRGAADYSVMLDQVIVDRFAAHGLAHFDETDDTTDAVRRMVVQTDAGPVLYDFRVRPPLVVRSDKRMAIKRVFWQSDDVVMQGTQGWFRIKQGVVTKLQSSVTTYH